MHMKQFIRKEPRIPFTKEGYQKLLDEKAKFMTERPGAVENLRKSREMGDLSENGYYKASRAQLSFLDARIRRVNRLVKLGKIVESTNSGIVEIGSHVSITDGKKEYDYSIVGGYESDPSKKTISHISPIGRALMGKRVQDSVCVVIPSGTVNYTITEIS
jgi:transcription elongation factor GreA